MSVSSKLFQIVALLRSEDAGTVSAATWALATYGTLGNYICTALSSKLNTGVNHVDLKRPSTGWRESVITVAILKFNYCLF